MAKEFLIKYKDIKDMFWHNTTLMFGYNPDIEENQNKIRKTKVMDSNPGFNREDSLVFIDVRNYDEGYNRQLETFYRDDGAGNLLTQITRYTNVVRCLFICYGPEGYDNAELIRSRILLPQYKELFAQNYFYPVPDIPAPVQMTEPFNGGWWERFDVEVRFYQYVERVDNFDYFNRLDIEIETDTGDVRVIELNNKEDIK